MIYLLRMITFAYNLSSEIKKNLNLIEELRKNIHLTSLPTKKELRLRWEAQLERIFWSLSLDNVSLNKKQVVNILNRYIAGVKLSSPLEKSVIEHKQSCDYLYDNWFALAKTITPKNLTDLTLFLFKSRPILSENNLRLFTNYLDPKTEHPIVIAAIAMIQTLRVPLLKNNNQRLARLMSYLTLINYGYDFRRLLVLEEYWHKNKEGYNASVASAGKIGNLTVWIEFYTDGIIIQLKKTLNNINSLSAIDGLSSKFFDLTDRQKAILNVFDQPDIQITNKKVQKYFKVSQITASRDLSKMANLGLLFPHGKGRSVYYTKII